MRMQAVLTHWLCIAGSGGNYHERYTRADAKQVLILVKLEALRYVGVN